MPSLNGVERKIPPPARTLLVNVETYIGKGINTLKTPAARLAFARSGQSWFTRYLAECEGTGGGGAVASGAGGGGTKTTTAGKATRSRGAGS
jgi:hypothetical protein